MKREGWDLGFYAFGTGPEAHAVSGELERRGYSVKFWGGFVLPGDNLEKAKVEFERRSRVLVGFGMKNAFSEVLRAQQAGRRFVPMLRTGEKAPFGAGGVHPLWYSSPTAAADILIRTLTQAPRG